MARQAEIRLGRFTLAEMHQAKLNLGLRAQGKNQETKGRGGSGISNSSGFCSVESKSLIN